jgi:hypothetical protein
MSKLALTTEQILRTNQVFRQINRRLEVKRERERRLGLKNVNKSVIQMNRSKPAE